MALTMPMRVMVMTALPSAAGKPAAMSASLTGTVREGQGRTCPRNMSPTPMTVWMTTPGESFSADMAASVLSVRGEPFMEERNCRSKGVGRPGFPFMDAAKHRRKRTKEK